MKINFGEEIQSIGLLAPVNIVATATGSAYVEMAKIGQGQLEFDVFFGVVTSTDSTGEVIVTAVTSTGGISTDTDTAIAFNYRLSGAVGTDTLGAITAATSAGVALPNTGDGKRLLIYVDPAVAQAHACRVVLTPTAETTVTNVAVTARFIPRHAQNALIDAVST